MNFRHTIAALVLLPVLIACGRGGDKAAPSTALGYLGVLGPGKSKMLARGQSINVPPSTILKDDKNFTVVIEGHGKTVYTPAGSMVSASSTAQDLADNVVIAK
jgi:hypothetical protein